MTTNYHEPVMMEEVLEYLAPRPGGVYVDGTVGGGGHARRIAQCLAAEDLFIGIDRDPAAIEYSRRMLRGAPPTVELIHSDWRKIPRLLDERQRPTINGCLLDLGVSSFQIDHPERGFSYRFPEAPLDMRMNTESDKRAADVLNTYSQRQLRQVLSEYGEERWASRIAKFIIERRQAAPFETVGDLIDVIKAAIPARARRTGGHPARRTFQALRIEVNDELVELEASLEALISRLASQGRMVAISFHSLEDRAVKRVFRWYSKPCRCPVDLPVCRCGGPIVEDLTPKPILPTEAEIERNPRASSAKLRAVRRF